MARPEVPLELDDLKIVARLAKHVGREGQRNGWVTSKSNSRKIASHRTRPSVTGGRITRDVCGHKITVNYEVTGRDFRCGIMTVSAPGWKVKVRTLDPSTFTNEMDGIYAHLYTHIRGMYEQRMFLHSPVFTNPEKFRHQMTVLFMFESEWDAETA